MDAAIWHSQPRAEVDRSGAEAELREDFEPSLRVWPLAAMEQLADCFSWRAQ